MFEFRAILLAATAAVSFWASAQEEPVRRYDANAPQVFEFEIKKTRDPVFPVRLRNEGYVEGYVIYAVYVDQFGALKDYLLLDATKLAFAKEVEKVLPQWEFSVPYVDGESAAIVSTVKVNFERSGVVLYESPGLTPLMPWYHGNEGHEHRIYGTWELDRLPEPIEMVKPDFHIELLEDRNLVTAVFEFYIDEEGRVRIPTLRNADDKVDERLLVIAQESLLRWRFAPPTVDGRKVVAKVAQPFRFKNSGEASEP